MNHFLTLNLNKIFFLFLEILNIVLLLVTYILTQNILIFALRTFRTSTTHTRARTREVNKFVCLIIDRFFVYIYYTAYIYK